MKVSEGNIRFKLLQIDAILKDNEDQKTFRYS